MSRIESTIENCGVPVSCTLRRGNSAMPVELVISHEGKTFVWEIPYPWVAQMNADAAYFVATSPALMRGGS